MRLRPSERRDECAHTPRISPASAARMRLRPSERSERIDGRGGRIRTGDLVVPNDARYQAAPRPDKRGSITPIPFCLNRLPPLVSRLQPIVSVSGHAAPTYAPGPAAARTRVRDQSLEIPYLFPESNLPPVLMKIF